MKKVLLIGDSIRLGYDKYVKESMKNFAEVYFTDDNDKFTANILRHFHVITDMLELYDCDVVHWNAGAWDNIRIYGDEPLTRPDVYADNVLRITKRIKYVFPEAKIIFATSTPVIESGYIDDFEYRRNEDVELYNKLAVDVVKSEGCIVNDLYGLLRDQPESLHSDQSHYYTPEATELIGMQVNRVICDALGVGYDKLTPPDKDSLVLRRAKSDHEMYEKRGHIYVYKRDPKERLDNGI